MNILLVPTQVSHILSKVPVYVETIVCRKASAKKDCCSWFMEGP
jgi:hypothetical protein